MTENNLKEIAATTICGFLLDPTHLNIKNLFSLALGLDRELELDVAFERLGWELDGPLHRGVDDAWNTAKLLAWLLEKHRTA